MGVDDVVVSMVFGSDGDVAGYFTVVLVCGGGCDGQAVFVDCGCAVPEVAHSACNPPGLVHPRRDLCIISPFPYIPYFARLTLKMSSLGPHEI